MKKNLDMTEGKPISLLWAFTFPTLMGNLLNQVYSITDSIVVGRYLGQTALAAVGSTMPVILLLAALMIGINVGVGIIISRYFGQKNEELMRRAFVNSLYLGLFLSAGMMVLGLTFSGTILRWMGTPEGPLQEATAYLEISFITMICPLMYYLFSSAFRGLGDSQTALYCLIVSVLSNIGLDVLFVAVFRWGVAGSAWATALAQALSAVVAAVLLFVVVTKGGYQMDRIRIWLDPFSSDLDRDLTHQTRQSLYAIGSGGLEVFGTPFMMAMMEHAAMDCVQPDLPEGKGTVGVDIHSSHLAPTPVGMTVRATATVTDVSENGKLITFRVEASDDWGPIGKGTHTRAIIANERFLQKCNSKLTEQK